MLGRFRQFQIRLAAVACLSLPAVTFAQDNVPAPPLPKDDAVESASAAAPAAEEAPADDGVARVPVAGCRPGGCSPATGCSSDGRCGNEPGRPGACSSDGCYAGGAACNGMPCMTYPGNSLSPEVCMGRGYTVGDLKRDLHGLKCRCRSACGLDDCQGGGMVHDWWYNQQYQSNCRRAYRNQVFNAWIHNKLNYFIPSGCCGEGCPPFGEYKRVYAADPSYYDQRDTQLYAAPATGVPTSLQPSDSDFKPVPAAPLSGVPSGG
jgi:hypothetical protein